MDAAAFQPFPPAFMLLGQRQDRQPVAPTITVRSQTRIPKRQTKIGNYVLPNVVLGLDGLLGIPRTHLQQTS